MLLTDSKFLLDNKDFVLFGNQHLVVVILLFFFGIILILWAQKQSNQTQLKTGFFFAFSLSSTVLIWIFLKIYLNGFDIKNDLPFHLCNFIALFLPLFTIYRKQVIYDILLFWILAGTSHAIITPDLQQGFPNFVFFKYWYVHAGLIIFIFYATFIYKMRPNFKSIFISFLAFQGYLLLMLFINKVTGANYLYTNQKPDGETLLTHLGDWPYYIFMVELFILPYFLIIYLPFHLTRKKQQQ